MKIRQGFVSNSSTTSFLVFGLHVENCNIDNITEKLKKEYQEKYGLSDEKLEKSNNKFLEWIINKDKDINFFYGYNDHYIGSSWDSISDDETGKQFKEKIYNSVKKIFPDLKMEDLSTYKEAFRDD